MNSLTADEKRTLVDAIEKSIRDIFGNAETLKKRVERYQDLLDSVRRVGGTNTIGVNALYFVPEFDGGFNTDSLIKRNSTPLKPLLSGLYFERVLLPAFEKRADKGLKLDDWLRKERENYTVQTPVP